LQLLDQKSETTVERAALFPAITLANTSNSDSEVMEKALRKGRYSSCGTARPFCEWKCFGYNVPAKFAEQLGAVISYERGIRPIRIKGQKITIR
jgi:hypothetical protein